MSDVIIDCTELFHNPIRTGIQRVVRELLLHWPVDGPKLHVARFDLGAGLVRIPEAAVTLLTDNSEETRHMPHLTLAAAVKAAAHKNSASPLPKTATRFIPEVFYDPGRCLFYWDRIAAGDRRIALLAFDFLPYLQPALFRLRSSAHLMDYLRLIQAIPHMAHISTKTREDYERRVMRGCVSHTGAVLPLGADGGRTTRQQWSSNRNTFVALGSIDGRKNQHVIVDAFLQLWRSGRDVPLTLIGHAFDSQDLSFIEKALVYPQFRWLKNATDEDVAAELTTARATIYIPEHEGFGLPPVESLSCGIPVITTQAVPSVSMLPSDGQMRLTKPERDLIANAVEHLMDDENAAAMWQSASHLQLSSWRDFGIAAAHWLAAI